MKLPAGSITQISVLLPGCVNPEKLKGIFFFKSSRFRSKLSTYKYFDDSFSLFIVNWHCCSLTLHEKANKDILRGRLRHFPSCLNEDSIIHKKRHVVSTRNIDENNLAV